MCCALHLLHVELFLTILSHACTALPVLQLDCYDHGTKVASVTATANGVAPGATLGIYCIPSTLLLIIVLHACTALHRLAVGLL
jgi:hypothetical protein